MTIGAEEGCVIDIAKNAQVAYDRIVVTVIMEDFF